MAESYVTIKHEINEELKALLDRFHEDVERYESLFKSQASSQHADQ